MQARALNTMREVLGEDFLRLSFVSYKLEASADGLSVLSCEVREEPSNHVFTIEGEGVGLVDAFFRALRERYRQEHPSLDTIRFSSFSVRGLIRQTGQDQASDAKAEGIVGITNSAGREFEFCAVTPSVTHSSIEGVLSAVEYFVNSERAYVRVYKALQHHKTTGRSELVGRYTELLGEMVRNTSYSSAVERLKTTGA